MRNVDYMEDMDMRQIVKVLCFSLGCMIITPCFSSIFSSSQAASSVPAVKAKESAQSTDLTLYATSKGKKVLKTVPVNTPVVMIIQQGKMWKIALRDADGTVGWINQQQYVAAKEAFYQPNVQAMYVKRTVDKDGKPEINVVVYRNGKQVSQAEAQKLYKSMQNNSAQQQDLWLAPLHNMMLRERREMIDLNKLFEDMQPMQLPSQEQKQF